MSTPLDFPDPRRNFKVFLKAWCKLQLGDMVETNDPDNYDRQINTRANELLRIAAESSRSIELTKEIEEFGSVDKYLIYQHLRLLRSEFLRRRREKLLSASTT